MSQDGILVIVHDDGRRQCCTLEEFLEGTEEWCKANMDTPELRVQVAELVQNCSIITLDGGAQTTGRRMWLESNEVDQSFVDDAPGAERFYVC